MVIFDGNILFFSRLKRRRPRLCTLLMRSCLLRKCKPVLFTWILIFNICIFTFVFIVLVVFIFRFVKVLKLLHVVSDHYDFLSSFRYCHVNVGGLLYNVPCKALLFHEMWVNQSHGLFSKSAFLGSICYLYINNEIRLACRHLAHFH